MRDITVDVARKLDTKTVFTIHIKNKDTGVIARETYKDGQKRWYPFYVRGEVIQSRYANIKYIASEDGRPPKIGFSSLDSSGYAFTSSQGVNDFIKWIDKNTPGIKAIMFVNSKSSYSNGVLKLTHLDFERMRIRARNFNSSKQAESDYLVRSTLSKLIPRHYVRPSGLSYSPGALEQFINTFEPKSLSLSDDDSTVARELLIGSIVDPQTIVTTKREIDRIYIEDVLQQFRELLKQRSETKLLEEKWHQFFKDNAWVFSQVYAYPAAFIKDKFNVGGYNIGGGTDKIIDFVYKNSLTQNITFIEIKTHLAKLINESPYRRPDIYSISRELGGVIVQALDQKTKFLKSFYARVGATGVEIDSLNSHCLVVIGSISSLDSKAKRDSFELFRNANKDVTVITFDELFKKIELMLEVFAKN